MSHQIHDRLLQMKPYEVLNERYRIRLDANESFLDPMSNLADEILSAVSKISFHRYPEDTCYDLRRAFGSFYGVHPELVVAGNGSDELIALLIGSFLQDEETLLVFRPEFSMYRIFGSLYGKKVVELEKEEEFHQTADSLLRGIKESKARMVLFSNPASPTSLALSRAEIKKVLNATDALIVVDEAYMDFSDQSVLDLVTAYDNLIVLKTSSKAMGAAAIRLGFAISNQTIINILNRIRPPYNVNSITQAIGTILYQHTEEAKQRRNQIVEEKNWLLRELTNLIEEKKSVKINPSETNFIFLFSLYTDEIFQSLREHSILVRKLENGLRITVGNRKENMEFLKVMRKVIGQLP